MNSIAVIPARGGSKRIPNKNIKILGGFPAIAYPIKIAKSSGLFKKIIVSTDNSEIANISKELGAEVPFLRSAKLSDDFTVTVDVIADATKYLIEQNIKFDYVCCIYPVTPLLKVERLHEAFKLITTGSWDYVFPALEFSSPIERSFKKNKSGKIEFTQEKFLNYRTQDISKTFHDAGQFYFGKTEAWVSKKSMLNGNSTFIELDKYEALDIDSMQDWDFIDKILKLNNKTKAQLKNFSQY
jgi:N-acylneuraminate cytidylyltransferase